MNVGTIATGVVIKVFQSYAILLFHNGETGLLHVSELSRHYVRDFPSYVSVGNIYRTKVIGTDGEKGNLRLSVKALKNSERHLGYSKILLQNADFTALKDMMPNWLKENA